MTFRDDYSHMLKNRRATRKYKSAELDEADVRDYLELIQQAPTAFNLQDYSIIVVQDPKVRDRVFEAANKQPQVASAPLLMAFVAEPEGWQRTLPQVAQQNISTGFWDDNDAKTRSERIASFQAVRREAGLTREFALRNAMIAATYGIVTAEAFGWSSSPMTGFDDTRVKEILGIPEECTVALLLAVGEPAETPRNQGRLPLNARVFVDKWS